MTLAKYVVDSKIRRKELIAMTIIGLAILGLLSSGSTAIQINGEELSSAQTMLPVVVGVLHGVALLSAVVLSAGTIPAEYENGTGQLVLVRGIGERKLHTSLALGNFLSASAITAVLHIGLVGFLVARGASQWVIYVPASFLITEISVLSVVLMTSALSTVLSTISAMVIGMVVTILGLATGVLRLLATMGSGWWATLLDGLTVALPNYGEIATQATNVLVGKPIQAHAIWVGLLFSYLFLTALLVLRRKEV